MYNYHDSVKKDVKRWLKEATETWLDTEDYRGMDTDTIAEDIYNKTYDSDTITGELLGYAMPEECKAWIFGTREEIDNTETDGNLDLALTAVVAQGGLDMWEMFIQTEDWVAIDCNIRGYILYDVIKEVVAEDILPKLR